MKHTDHIQLYKKFDDISQRTGKSPLVRDFSIQTLAFDKSELGEMDIPFVLSTEGIKRDDSEVMQDGWHLDDYRSNPVVLWAHQGRSVPIAQAREVKVEKLRGLGKSLTAIDRFEDFDFAQLVHGLYKKKTLNAVSVGWRTLKYELIRDEENDYIIGIRFLEQDLVEHSAVPVPADPQALQRAFQSGEISQDLTDRFALNSMFREIDPEIILYLGSPQAQRVESKTHIDLGSKQPGKERTMEFDKLTPQAVDREAPKTGDDGTDAIVAAPKRGTLPFLDEVWNPSAALRRVREWATKDSALDQSSYGNCFLIPDLSEKRSHVGLYVDIVEGVPHANKNAIRNLAQKLMRGSFGTEKKAAITESIEQEYVAMGESFPWDRAVGATYQSSCERLDGMRDDDPDKGFLQATIVEAGKRLFGESRLTERWEDTDDIWTNLRNRIAPHLPGSSEEREVVADGIVDTIRPLLRTHEQALVFIREAFKLTGLDKATDLLDRISEIGNTDSEPELELNVERIQKALDKIPNQGLDNKRENATDEDEDMTDSFGSLFERLNSRLPVAG